jgi:phytoene desaturase
MSLVVIYFGTKKRYADRRACSRTTTSCWDRATRACSTTSSTTRALADDFSLYLHMPTITDPTIAPEGHESFYVLSPVPNLKSGISWATHAQLVPRRDHAAPRGPLPPRPAGEPGHRALRRPALLRDRLHAAQGSAFSVEPILTQSAWFRPHNRSEDIPNLYLVGAGTHPGAGLPGVLSSAKIADDLINAA